MKLTVPGDPLRLLPAPPRIPPRHRRNAGKLRPSAPLYPTGKPDTSNLLKLPEDALVGLAYDDDAQIIHAEAHKHFGDPRTVIEVWALTRSSPRMAPGPEPRRAAL